MSLTSVRKKSLEPDSGLFSVNRVAVVKIEQITFLPHGLKRKYRWQTASYTADAVQARNPNQTALKTKPKFRNPKRVVWNSVILIIRISNFDFFCYGA